MMIEETPTTPEGFRRLDHETIFIAGSQDVLGLRADVEWAIKSVIHQLAPNTEFRPYSWDIELADSGFDQTKSMQKSIPRPSDPLCVGVLCLMAERIGYPFADEKAHNLIHNIEDWTNPKLNYRLLHPWPTDPDKQKWQVEQGCYPLTGTVFEFIDAYSTLKVPKTPLWFSVIADKPIDSQNYATVGLGNYRLRTKKANSLTNPDFLSWIENDYNLQTAAVKNFVCALIQKEIHPNTLQTREQVISEAKRFVAREVIKQHVGTVNPYKALNYFDVFDADNFRGRSQEIERAANDLFDRFDSNQNNAIRIVGNSGSGKSSFLRAGLIAHFHRPEFRRNIRTVVFSKADLDKADGTPVELIRSIFDLVAKQTDLVIPPRRIDICKQGLRAAGLAVELLQELLPLGTNGKKSQLIFAIDQFEEILDCLADPNLQRHWYPLAQFMDIASRSEAIGIAYAVERSRKEALSQPNLPAVFSEKDEIEIDGYGSEFIRSIIDKPFKSASYPLCREVVKEIADKARDLRQVGEDSILPLIALKLSRLFESIHKHGKPIANGGLRDVSEGAFDEHAPQTSLCITRDQIKEPLEFNSLIAGEADRAWASAGKNTFDNEDLDHFLQPLVTVGGSNFDDIQLQTMQQPPYSAEQRIAESFKRRRLLVANGKGFRLVHKAIVKDWGPATKWFEKKQEFLKKQELYRHKAWEWSNQRKSQNTASITQENINDVAEILTAYRRAWALVGETSDSLAPEDRLLFDYCLFVFRQSQTPREPITYMGTDGGMHVHRAAAYGLVDLLEKFYKADPDCIHVPTKDDGNTPLHMAAWAHENTVKFLLKNGAKSVKNKEGWRPIASAIQMGDMNIFNRLLKASKGKGLDIPGGGNLLHTCADLGETRVASTQVTMARYLCDLHGLDPRKTNDYQWLPLHVAAHSGHLEAFKYFADHSDVTQAGGSDKSTSLHLASAQGHTAIIEYLLADPRFEKHIKAQTASGETALHLACQNLRSDVVKLLIRESDPNQPIADKTGGRRPLHLALENSGAEEEAIVATARALLENDDIDPNAKDPQNKTPLVLAEKVDEVKRLLIHHPKINPDTESEGVTALSVSANLGDWDALRTLQKRSANPHGGSVDKKGNTMLHFLIEKDAPQHLIEQTLSAKTVDANALNEAGLTPLLLAIQLKRWSLVRELLKVKEIDPTIHGERQLPVMMLALEMKADLDTLKKLVEVNTTLLTQRDYFGWTPLHRAVAGQRLDLIERLTQVAKDPENLWAQTDRLGRQPSDLASPLVQQTRSLVKTDLEWPAPRSWNTDLIWKPVKGQTLARLMKRIDALGSGPAPAKDRDIQTTVLPFYNQKTVRLVRVKSPSWNQPAVAFYYLDADKNLYHLNGTSPPIHEVNHRSTIALTQENVLDYLRFFCFFVRTGDDPFLIAEGLSQPEIPEGLTDQERAALAKVLRPALYCGYLESGKDFYAMATMYYLNSISICDFKIHVSGTIEMIGEVEDVIKNLSAKVNEPIRLLLPV